MGELVPRLVCGAGDRLVDGRNLLLRPYVDLAKNVETFPRWRSILL